MSKKPVNEPPQKRSLAQEFMIPGLVFGGAIIVALLVLMFGQKLTESSPAGEVAGTQMSTSLEEKFLSEYDKLGVSVGPDDADLVVREFADYQCPACGAFAPTAERIREEYAEAGKLKFVFFDFPLSVHGNASAAASAARCAGRQGAFWTFHEKLFDSQRNWSGQSDPTGTFLDIAVESGVSVKPFRQCLEQGAMDEIVAQNAEIAKDVGISSTPTILIGRQVLPGIKTFDVLQTEIDNQLAAKPQ